MISKRPYEIGRCSFHAASALPTSSAEIAIAAATTSRWAGAHARTSHTAAISCLYENRKLAARAGSTANAVSGQLSTTLARAAGILGSFGALSASVTPDLPTSTSTLRGDA